MYKLGDIVKFTSLLGSYEGFGRVFFISRNVNVYSLEVVYSVDTVLIGEVLSMYGYEIAKATTLEIAMYC